MNIAAFFTDRLPADVPPSNKYCALIVRWAKDRPKPRSRREKPLH